jgi:predicted DsbA family dithiol-disulfide isomerase
VTERIVVDVWSDVVCPWCYIGKRRLEDALRRFAAEGGPPVEVVYHSFQLDSSFPNDYDGSAIDYLVHRKGVDEGRARAMHRHVTHVASTVGLTYDFDRLRPANTGLAHQLLHLALDRGAQQEVKEALFRAHFTEGRDISDLDTLVAIAGDSGIGPETARRALEDGRHARTVDEDIRLAARIGIQGVPFFVFDGRIGVSGAQPPETMVEALRQVAEPAA